MERDKNQVLYDKVDTRLFNKESFILDHNLWD